MLQIKFRRTLAIALSAGLLLSSSAAAVSKSTCDEAYYVNLDYYGAVKDSNIVKSYSLNGENSITDYGDYTEIKNMTNYVEPIVQDNKIEFDFSDDVPARFYFEGKTVAPLSDLPWDIQVSYKLNGVPTDADKLAGERGLVEIDLDLIPNQNARAYYRNNMILTATAMVDADKMLSTEAEGAQIQSVGNLKAVMFMALPGEEQHFELRLGSDSFEFGGWVFLMTPATLAQLEDIADLREDKETVEDSADTISDSLDIILDTLNSLSDSLSSTANGLDTLDDARQTISSGKSQIYSDADQSLKDLQELTERMQPFDEHLMQASSAMENLNQDLNSIQTTLDDLKSNIESLQTVAKGASLNLSNLTDFAEYLQDNRLILEMDIDSLTSALKSAATAMNKIQTSIDPSSLDTYISNTAKAADSNAYVLTVQKDTLTAIKSLLSAIKPILTETADLTDFINAILEDIDEDYYGQMVSLIDNLHDGTVSLDSTMSTLSKLIDNINELNTLMNDHHDGLIQLIEDCRSLNDTAQQSIMSLHTFLTDTEALLKTSGGELDDGTKATLAGLSRALRKSAQGLQQTEVIKNAKDTVKDLTDDKWDEYTGEDNNLLLMDSNAPLESLTASENPAPSSLQILLRTDEIKLDDDKEAANVDESFHAEGTFFTRVASIFNCIWDAILGVFR